MRRTRQRFFLFIVGLLIAATAATRLEAGDEAPAATIKISAPEPHPWWPSLYATPLWAVIENGSPGDLVELSLSTRSLVQRGTLRLPDSGRHRAELTAYVNTIAQFTWTVAGQSDTSWVSPSRNFGGDDSQGQAWVVSLDGALYREMLAVNPDIAAGGGQSEVKAEIIPHTALPSRYQGFAGFYGTIVAGPQSLRAITPEQRTALGRAVLWLGVRLWVVGAEMADVLPLLGLKTDLNGAADSGNAVQMVRLGNGVVLTLADSDAQTFLDTVSRSRPHDLLARFYNSTNIPDYARFTDGLEGVGVWFILTSLLVLGLVLGPVNYWYVRRRKNPLLFFILTPMTAVVGGVAILVGSAVVEGGGGRYNEHAVLVARTGDDDAFLLDYRLVRPGFWLSDVRYSDDTIVLPGDTIAASPCVIDWTDGIRLGPGWFQSRAVSAYLAARPVVARLAIAVTRESAAWRIRNNLDHDIVSALVRTESGNVQEIGPVAAGSDIVIPDATRSTDYSGQVALAELLNAIAFTGDSSRVRLVAECRGVPYIDDGGFGGWRVNGRYYYVLLDEALEDEDD
ncbi:MAG: hypothetical protein LIQ31_11175 [Planctomycetes bacterium]|nr:hypothetical protein [Planctomycetota bacterium]